MSHDPLPNSRQRILFNRVWIGDCKIFCFMQNNAAGKLTNALVAPKSTSSANRKDSLCSVRSDKLNSRFTRQPAIDH
jgi:hypothetical protein